MKHADEPPAYVTRPRQQPVRWSHSTEDALAAMALLAAEMVAERDQARAELADAVEVARRVGMDEQRIGDEMTAAEVAEMRSLCIELRADLDRVNKELLEVIVERNAARAEAYDNLAALGRMSRQRDAERSSRQDWASEAMRLEVELERMREEKQPDWSVEQKPPPRGGVLPSSWVVEPLNAAPAPDAPDLSEKDGTEDVSDHG